MRRVVVPLAALVLVAGCGKSSVTKQEYAKQANAVCARYAARIAGLPQASPATLQSTTDLIRRTAALVRKENAALRRLESPTRQRKAVRAMLVARDRLIDLFERNAGEIARASTEGAGEPTHASRLARLQRVLGPPSARAARLATKLALTVCASEFGGGAQ
ncbi:MAG: hypothetical protein M3R70_11255 [Actinomycetota bacterium]|nr:hypothetical protein [Actinomycetota bacterium]